MVKDGIVDHSLTLTKLHPPSTGGELVPRPHLLERLNQQQQLTLVLAPAGYGKTTLLSTWLRTCGFPSAWLSLDEHDDDFSVFTTYFLTAVQTLFPDVGAQTLPLLNGVTMPPLQVVARHLRNELDAIQQDFILVLDDYHVIQTQMVHELLIELLRHPPRALHLVLIARHDPPLPLASLRARGHVVELRTADLRFTIEEAAMLVRDVMAVTVDERTISALETKTEGWPVGLRLAALSLRHKGSIEVVASDSSSYSRYVMDYLVAEVLSRLPISVQEFLIKTSILDQLCGPLCEAVTGMIDRMFNGQYILEWLERADLFLAPVDEQRRWYRCHHLFRQLLTHRLEQLHGPAEIAALHMRASQWFAQNRFLDEALHHALAAGDRDTAVQVVAQHRHELMNQAQWQRLDRWVHLFPREVIDVQPDLLLIEVWLKFILQQLSEVPALLDRMESLLSEMPPAVAERLQGEVEARRSAQYYWAGDSTRSLNAGHQALAKIPAEWWYVRGYTRLFISAGYQMRGDLAQAYATLYATGELNQGRGYQNLLTGAACFIHWIAADLLGMAQAARQVLAGNNKWNHAEVLAWSHLHLGLYYYQRNDLAAAETHLMPLVLQPYATHALCFLNSAVLLACIRQAQGQPEGAREIADVMLSFALETRSEVVLFGARAFQAELALRQGRLADAGRWAQQYGTYQPTPAPYYYVPPLTLAMILLAQGTSASRQQARQLLSQMDDYFTAIHYTSIRIRIAALQAMLYNAEGDKQQALAALRKSIGLAEPGGFIRFFVDLDPQLKPLLAELAQRGVAPAYIAEIYAAFGQPAILPLDVAQPEIVTPASTSQQTRVLVEGLTNREIDVLLLLARRLTNKEIAQTLGVSPNTVKQHTITLFQKLHVHNRRQAVAWAREQGLLPDAVTISYEN